MQTKPHEGRNVKRIREILGIKQETLAIDLGLSQQAISNLEQKETLDAKVLEEIAAVLKMPVEAIKHFDEQTAIFSIQNMHDNSHIYQYNLNPVDKWLEALEEGKRLNEKNEKLYERLLQLEREKNELLKETIELLKEKRLP